ncbi:MAG: NAD-dependent epimerase/dehydratase family protein [Polyangiaceae bacterium]|nr:NAD-dependent epimerase/dehydratase family protein [Polyangiaceae bacterium]
MSQGNGASQSKRYWVGGATGFLGAHLAAALRDAGHEVVGVSRSGGELEGVEVRAVDVLDEAAVCDSARGMDGAFLCTGLVSRNPDDAELLHRMNVTAVRTALSGLRRAGVRRVVVASTSGTIAIGKEPDQIFDEDSPAPVELISRFPYYRSKLYGEREALDASDDELEVVVVNPTLLLGPGDFRDSSTEDVRRFLEREIPAIPQGGIAFVDVRDAATGMVAAFERGRARERYLLNGKNMTMVAFFQRLERLTGVTAPRLVLPASRALAVGANALFSRAIRGLGGEPPVDETTFEMGCYYWYASSAKAERELGFVARDPGETLRDTVEDLIRRGAAHPRTSEGLPDAARRALAAIVSRARQAPPTQ